MLVNDQQVFSESLLESRNPRILNCDSGQNVNLLPGKCDLFFPVLTSRGIGFGFNQKAMENVLSLTPESQNFIDAFKMRKKQRLLWNTFLLSYQNCCIFQCL